MAVNNLFIISLFLFVNLGDAVTTIPRIFLFSAKEFEGNSFGLSLYPGCNNIVAFGWDKTATSIVRSSQCIILYEKMNCRGHSVKITNENESDLKDLARIGFNHRFSTGLSSVAKCDSDTCTALGTFIKPGYCNKYFRCTDPDETGVFTKKNYACPENQQFDPKRGHCTRPEKIFPKVTCD